MGFARRTLRFSGGMILGAAVGTAVSMLFTPQSGEELKAELTDRREEALRAGEEAEILETERLQRAYRIAVNDPLAFTGKFDGMRALAAKSEGDAVAARAIKERDEAEKALREAKKADDELRKVQEQARKAEEQARKARETAAKESAEATQAHDAARGRPS